MASGVDILGSVNNPSDVKAAGYEFIGRYPATLSTAEVKAISQAALYIVSIKEVGGAQQSTTTYSQGVQDGSNAQSEYKALGMPEGFPIYYAIDWTGSTATEAAQVLDYFNGVKAGMLQQGTNSSGGLYYAIGMYGENYFCTYVHDNDPDVTYFWGTENFSSSQLAFMALWQYSKQVTIDGQVYDTDVSNGDAGGWQNING